MTVRKVIFYGTPEFAVPSLKALYESGCEIAAVVTSPDKPSGRGQKITQSAVKEYAAAHSLRILQPDNLSAADFVTDIKRINPDVQIVVAFRKLPYEVYSVGQRGTINLHASLLPQYRGAAPINHAIMNGEKETGLTTFFINDKIDTGNLILQQKISIQPHYDAGDLHDILKEQGAVLILQSLEEIGKPDFQPKLQEEFLKGIKVLKKAPKIFKEDCRINWRTNACTIVNKIRGLSPFPGAFTELISPQGQVIGVKIFKAAFEEIDLVSVVGNIETDGKTYLRVYAERGFVELQEIQLPARGRLAIRPFLSGFSLNNEWRMGSA